MSDVKYPQITVQLSGTDGNAFALLARMRKALRQANVPQADIDAFMAEAMGGDYNNLLQVCMRTVEVE